MAEEGRREREADVPCAALKVLEVRVNALERAFAEHARAQNSHLTSIDARLGELTNMINGNARERTEQIGDLKASVAENFATMFKVALGMAVPIVAGLLYIILNHALASP